MADNPQDFPALNRQSVSLFDRPVATVRNRYPSGRPRRTIQLSGHVAGDIHSLQSRPWIGVIQPLQERDIPLGKFRRR